MKVFKETLCFDDVLLEPQRSDIKSRSEISLDCSIGDNKYQLPIISSPMDTVTGQDMGFVMNDVGGLGIVHRYCTIDEQCAMLSPGFVTAAAVGVSDDFKARVARLKEHGLKTVCVDVAHGHHTMTESALKYLKDTYGSDLNIIAGNVATAEAFLDLSRWGADAIRVGIGGGSICSCLLYTSPSPRDS